MSDIQNGSAALRPFTLEGIAKFKMPEQMAIWDTLPKNAAGKVLKHKIRAVLIGAAS